MWPRLHFILFHSTVVPKLPVTLFICNTTKILLSLLNNVAPYSQAPTLSLTVVGHSINKSFINFVVIYFASTTLICNSLSCLSDTVVGHSINKSLILRGYLFRFNNLDMQLL